MAEKIDLTGYPDHVIEGEYRRRWNIAADKRLEAARIKRNEEREKIQATLREKLATLIQPFVAEDSAFSITDEQAAEFVDVVSEYNDDLEYL